MPHAYLIAAATNQTWPQHWAVGTNLSSFGFFWLGFINVLMLLTFLAAALRKERPSRRDGARGHRPGEAGRTDHPLSPPSRAPRSAETPALVRASDGDRDGATETVCRAIADGSLTLEEGVERIDVAVSARYRAELARLVADLPQASRREEPKPADVRGAAARAGALLVAAAAVTFQVLAGTWVLWPVAVGALMPFLFFARRRPGRR